VAGGVEGGVPGGVVGGVVGGLPTLAAAAATAGAVRVGGNIRPPQKIRDVKPVYPSIAQSARVQGVVIIEATIVLMEKSRTRASCVRFRCSTRQPSTPCASGIHADPAQRRAPVPVIMTVTVNFTLQ